MLTAALVAILIADLGVLAGSTRGPDARASVEVTDDVIGRGLATPGAVPRRAPHRPRSATRQRPPAPPAFSSGGGPAPPAPTTQAEAPGWLERRGALALDRISYPWQQLGFSVEFRPGRRGLRAVTYTRERRIVVFVRRGESVAETAFDLAHEIGHAFDVVHGTWPRRERWLELRGLDPATPWFGCNGCDDLSTGAGDLAEVFALWQVGPAAFASRLAGPPDPAQLADLVQLFDPTWTSRTDPTRSGSADDGSDQDGPDGERDADQSDDDGGGGQGTDDADASDGGSDAGSDAGGDPGDRRGGDDAGQQDPADDGDDGDDEDDDGQDRPLPCPVICGMLEAA